MMLKKTFLLLAALCCLAFTGVPPQSIHDALRHRYPQATDITWKQVNGNYVATFLLNGFLTHAWMTPQGTWLLTDADLQTTDELPSAVYTGYTLSRYADWDVTDVHCLKRKVPSPLSPTPADTVRYVLTVNYDNSTETYQLFYTPEGNLMHIRDVSYLPCTLTPDDF